MSQDLSQERAAEAEELVHDRDQRAARQDVYVADLVTRLNKLKAKEKTFDEYISELEEKLRSSDDLTLAHQNTVNDLRLELVEERAKSKAATEKLALLDSGDQNTNEFTTKCKAQVESLSAELQEKERVHGELQERIQHLSSIELSQMELVQELQAKQVMLDELESRANEAIADNAFLAHEKQDLAQKIQTQAQEMQEIQAQLLDAEERTRKHGLKALNVDQSAFDQEEEAPTKVPGTPLSADAHLPCDPTDDASLATALSRDLEVQKRQHEEALQKLAEMTRQYQDTLETVEHLTAANAKLQKAASAKGEQSSSPGTIKRSSSAMNLALSPDKTGVRQTLNGDHQGSDFCYRRGNQRGDGG